MIYLPGIAVATLLFNATCLTLAPVVTHGTATEGEGEGGGVMAGGETVGAGDDGDPKT